jgi:hypothetical protein
MKETNPICVLSGDYKQYCDYIKSQGATYRYDPRWVHGSGETTVVGFHFEEIVEIGTFAQRADADKIRALVTLMLKTKPFPKPFLLPKKAEPMKAGEIRKLPKVNSPMWTDQWAYQGTAKLPYIISGKRVGGYNGLESALEWACSCRSWMTGHRQNCKHIVAVMMKEGILITVGSPTMNPEIKKDFEKYLAQQAANKIQSEKSPLEERGRRFRTE